MSFSKVASASATGVLPAPPAMKFPTQMTGRAACTPGCAAGFGIPTALMGCAILVLVAGAVFKL